MENNTMENIAPKNRPLNINWMAIIMGLAVIVVVGALFLKKGEAPQEAYVASPAKPVAIDDISTKADDIPLPIAYTRTENKNIVVNLDAVQLVSELADGTTYEYWTFNSQVPGPFIRAMEGDTVEVHLTHSHDHIGVNTEESKDFLHSFTIDSFTPLALAQGHEHAPGTPDDHHDVDTTGIHAMPDGTIMNAKGETLDDAKLLPNGNIQLGSGQIVGGGEGMTDAEHIAAGHGEHSIDLHAVQGFMGGAELIRTAPNDTEAFRFKAEKPGIYLYHCGSPHVATHIANGMYGMILVEPKGGLSPVDREFYVVQGEFYTKGSLGEKGHQEYSLEKLVSEDPEYVVFNGRMGALTGDNALRAKVGETVRIFFGVSGQLASSFHVIGEIMDKVYREGDILSPPAQNIQTTIVPAGGAMMTEFVVEVPGTYLLVDHALSRALNRGAVGQLVVEGNERPDLIEKVQ
jgi:copper-containing nitrite reductase